MSKIELKHIDKYYGKNHNNAYEIPTYKTAPR